MMREIIVLVGPTAIGKTAYAIELAKKIDAEIINADSVQVYQELNIGSAKPKPCERAEIVHHLVDYVAPDYDYNVRKFQEDGRAKIAEIHSRGKNVIVVGGTGLYIQALLYEYQFTNNKNYEIVIEKLRKLNELQLKKLTKKYNVINSDNNRRLINELAKHLLKLPVNESGNQKYYENFKVIGLTTDREIVYERINKRVLKMFDQGLIEEVKKFNPSWPSQRSIGYKEVHQYLAGEISLEDCIALIQRNTRRFAKRQYTWFNNKLNVRWYDVKEGKWQ